ncbi:cyclic lactone autoinducer peptide [Paenibacillus sp. YN15]|uniref:cyclic lactone autoinducer peptide n=1 Tax=Paenibacillus sp. YN15 TaxID=1742774 RepID=UPI000DCD9F50|nr:cyclic lactone autoinducer peptide [Paenibacillus sp. YN15]RAU96860.1 cyclic lactone autoinducer peptide [Paenibacillus sp. YN15]
MNRVLTIKNLPWKVIGLAATAFAMLGANITCWWIAHEPEMPKEVKNFKKI